MASTLTDTEFGAIRVKRVHAAKHIRLRITAEGVIVATLPNRAPIRLVKRLVDESREELRRIISAAHQKKSRTYTDSERIGASHKLHFIESKDNEFHVTIRNQAITVSVPIGSDSDSVSSQETAKKGITKALKKEAAAYLPRRLSYLAEQYNFSYKTTRFTNAKGRWGSCSSGGTISLNIALMNLPMEIIDYILVHELCHTREMNHSQQFWAMVEIIRPAYKEYRRLLKDFTPYL